VILHHRYEGDFRTGSRRGGDGDEGFQRPFQRPGAAEFHEIVRPFGNHDVDPLGRIHHRSPAHGDQGIAAPFPIEGGQTVHHPQVGIGGYVVGDHADFQMGTYGPQDYVHQSRPGDAPVGDHHGPPGVKLPEHNGNLLQGVMSGNDLHAARIFVIPRQVHLYILLGGVIA